jgi:predicted nucleic acid-binding Zn ribbon protein
LIGGGIGIVFKGSGFYATDSRQGKPAPAASSDDQKPQTKKKQKSKAKKDSAQGAKSSAAA